MFAFRFSLVVMGVFKTVAELFIFSAICEEIFPYSHTRGRGIDLALLTNFGSNALVTFAFSPLKELLGTDNLFLLFAGIVNISLVHSFCCSKDERLKLGRNRIQTFEVKESSDGASSRMLVAVHTFFISLVIYCCSIVQPTRPAIPISCFAIGLCSPTSN
ncbi:hypothetical protein IFM89_001198 [Coptis chinensis]|uniref:Major facilitator superfamily (MFS) profile domain-containing protein n=1 Tax=Coptis chinensis TaxID=261450 RepID=A0A835M8M5_9MAGN|nr:hypothetical protein IFM89_001198 [Coptis chinensis]